MATTFHRFTLNIKGRPRKEKLEGRTHLVVPAVMLTEDVIAGSEGAYFYPAEENGKNPAAWDHMPLVVDHPKVGNEFVSARQKQFLDSRKVGILLNTKHEDGKLKTECWFDVERTKAVDKRVYNAVRKGEQMEVSTGLGVMAEMKAGEYKGKKYKGIARDHQPDHLAVLPDSVGACSIKMGGGLFANASQEPESVTAVLSRSVENALERLGMTRVGVDNEMSFSDITRQLSSLLSAKYGEKGRYWEGWVRDVYKDAVVFSDGSGKLFQIGYTASETEGVSLVGTAVQVVATTGYATLDGKKYFGNDGSLKPAEDDEMAFDRNKHLTSLIGNGGYAETDRGWLSALPDTALQNIKPVNAAANPPPAAPPPVPEPAPVIQINPANASSPVMTRDQILGLLGPEFMAVHNQGQKALVAARNTYTAKVIADPNNKFTAEALARMDIDTLAGLAEIARTPEQVNNQQASMFANGWQPSYGAGFAPVFNAGEHQPQPVNNAAVPPEAASGGLPRPRLYENKTA